MEEVTGKEKTKKLDLDQIVSLRFMEEDEGWKKGGLINGNNNKKNVDKNSKKKNQG